MSAPALAADDNTPTNPERSFIRDAPPTLRTKAEVRAELDAFRHNPVTSRQLTAEEMKIASIYYKASM
jgi:hypothetical protein